MPTHPSLCARLRHVRRTCCLKQVVDWLDGASDTSGGYERRFMQLETESEEAAYAARTALNQVHNELNEREALAQDRLQMFASELNETIRKKVRGLCIAFMGNDFIWAARGATFKSSLPRVDGSC